MLVVVALPLPVARVLGLLSSPPGQVAQPSILVHAGHIRLPTYVPSAAPSRRAARVCTSEDSGPLYDSLGYRVDEVGPQVLHVVSVAVERRL
jgi:hypothetical protein